MRSMRRAACAWVMVAVAGAASGCAPLLFTGAAMGTVAGLDRRTVGAQLEDQSLQVRGTQRIKAVLDGSDSAYAYVNAYNRRLLLTGLAPDEASRERAGRIASGLDNVRDVFNEIQVGKSGDVPGAARDTATTAQVKTAVARAEQVDGSAVKVVTEAGIVYLMGIVTQREADAAIAAARKVSGVRKVVTLFEFITEAQLAEIMKERAAKPADTRMPHNN